MCGNATPHFVVKHDHHKWLLAAVVVRKNARLSTSDLFAASLLGTTATNFKKHFLVMTNRFSWFFDGP